MYKRGDQEREESEASMALQSLGMQRSPRVKTGSMVWNHRPQRWKRCCFNSWVGKIPWRRVWQLTPVFLPEKSNGQRSLEGYSPKSCKESDVTEQVSTQHRALHSSNLMTHWLVLSLPHFPTLPSLRGSQESPLTCITCF